VIEECVRIRREFGYPIMITPYSQYVGTQAALHVATGTRYGIVIDELIRFAQGSYGDDSGHLWMDQNLKDKLVGSGRAKELAVLDARTAEELTLPELRAKLGGPGVSDEELLMRTIMQGTREIDAMRAAGPPRRYYTSDMPLLKLLQELKSHSAVRYIKIQRGADSIVVRSRAPTASAAALN
jgi:oxaloacetate decarboxylase alpha subunit